MTSAPTNRSAFIRPSQQDQFVRSVWPTIAPMHEVEKLTCGAIARVLTERGVPLPRNGKWTNTKVRSIVMRAYALGLTNEPARIYPEPKPAPVRIRRRDVTHQRDGA